VYLSSADFLPRNFDSRFEIVFPVRDAGLASELMQYFELQWHDTVKARVLDAALSNRMPVRRSRGIRCQEAIPDWLSGKAEGE
jgi:polyphosphate kinase